MRREQNLCRRSGARLQPARYRNFPWRPRPPATLRARAAIVIADQDAAALVHIHAHKVEHVAADVRAAAEPDAAALHGIVRRHIHRMPGLAAIVGVRDVKMPDTGETRPLQSALVGVP